MPIVHPAIFVPLRRAAALLATLVLAAGPAWGGAIFKYKDAAGVTHYTDQRPASSQPVEIFQLFGSAPEQQRTVFIEKRGSAERPELYVVNQNQAPVEVRFALTEQDNVAAPAIPEQWIVPAKGTLKLAELQPRIAGVPMRYDYRLRWQLGDPRAAPTANFAYGPPLPAQGLFTVSQGFDGGLSHNTPGSRYAIDIGMPIGTGIRAARGGSVVSVQDRHGAGGNSVAYRSQTNSVYILHDDGTFGVYAHLRQGSALVRPGQRVQGGQIIAQSGNSGYSTAPHLHFAVLRNAGMHWESLPFKLSTPAGPVTPTRGLVLNGDAPRNSVASLP
jgi:murein DD-endopeptidase MepM/ murein hydrolase activator NlpD